MSLKQTHRFIFRLVGCLRPSPSDAPIMNMADVLTILQTRFDAGQALKPYNNGSVIFRIRQIKFFNQNKYAVVLLSTADKDFTIPQVENFDNGNIRTVDVAANEGNAYSAHLLIKLAPQEEGLPKHKMLLEHVPGISRHYVKLFLTSEIKEGHMGTFQNVNHEEKRFRALLELDGKPSLTIREALENGGVLENISFVTTGLRQDGTDEEPCIEDESAEITLKVARGVTSDRATGLLQRQINKFKELGSKESVIRIHTDKGTRSAFIDLTEEDNFLEQGFFQLEKVDDFANPLQQAPAQIRDDLVYKMIGLLEADEDEQEGVANA